MTVQQSIEKFSVFNHSKKCSLNSGDFRNKTCIFCAAVVNKKAFWQRKNRAAIDKDRASPSNDNFLITIPFFSSFVPLITVLFVVERS